MSEFQSLIGRLQTLNPDYFGDDAALAFQSLIGRLQTQ